MKKVSFIGLLCLLCSKLVFADVDCKWRETDPDRKKAPVKVACQDNVSGYIKPTQKVVRADLKIICGSGIGNCDLDNIPNTTVSNLLDLSKQVGDQINQSLIERMPEGPQKSSCQKVFALNKKQLENDCMATLGKVTLPDDAVMHDGEGGSIGFASTENIITDGECKITIPYYVSFVKGCKQKMCFYTKECSKDGKYLKSTSVICAEKKGGGCPDFEGCVEDTEVVITSAEEGDSSTDSSKKRSTQAQ